MCADCQQIVTLLTRMANESATKVPMGMGGHGVATVGASMGATVAVAQGWPPWVPPWVPARVPWRLWAQVAVEGFLRRECAALPVPTMVTPCQNLVHEYFSLLLTDLEEHLKPSAICARLELCPEQPGGAPAAPPLRALSARLQVRDLGAGAGGCPGASTRGLRGIGTGTGASVGMDVGVCGHRRGHGRLRGRGGAACVGISTGISAGIRAGFHRGTSAGIHTGIFKGPYAATSTGTLGGTPVAAGDALPVPLPLCWLCRTFLARAQAAVPKEAVATAAAGLCRVLPVVAVGACQCLAQRYARYAVLAVEEVLGRLAPRLLCHLLLSCRPEDGYASLSPPWRPLEATAGPPAGRAGTEDLPALSPNPGPCALGPTYWCSSPAAARRCQALQHCQEHVWA
ncbi:PREDICTED: uncharacterized protein LOC104023369 [Nipponia nippon]|uniref:uncharacterized protein LOC104023369 n=1 Tax=Nipponia nippon TaxID=128390 RepID=UPI000511A7E7|nr:PREDICTED: uncharacterized protein LOC104023369 [Nipponia nippon]